MWILLLLLLLPATAAEPVSLEMQVAAEDYALSQETRSTLKRTLSRMLGFYSGVFALEFPATVEVRIRILGDRADFDAASRAINAPHWSTGFFTRNPNEGVLWGNTSVDAMMRVFLHESSHFLMNTARARPPRWANEGLAECFENARLSGNSIYLDPIPRTVRWLQAEQRAGRWQSAERVMKSNPSWNQLTTKDAGARYAYGWALSHFLLSSMQGKEVLKDILISYQMGRGSSEALEVVEKNYRGGLEQFEEDWITWLLEGPTAISVPIGQSGANADGWTRCPDGRLVAKDSDVGCKTWVKQPDGSLKLQ